ncbi:hypothetical protein HRI_001409800 [Hibiscus trionum]|uniref:Uncharacterized protein n=2 Tax=Hibiscus trionum TaxID=183268 RepID=A0A9W7LU66_HIBTR|nr:hypothetical protein HRI_001409800 [Hibiscus trionum]
MPFLGTTHPPLTFLKSGVFNFFSFWWEEEKDCALGLSRFICKEFLKGLFEGCNSKTQIHTRCLEAKPSSDIMKPPVLWVFFFVVGTALLVFTFSNTSSIPNMDFSKNGEVLSITGTSRKLKGKGYNPSNEKKSGVDLEDYRHRIDPVPSSKASIKPGPIEHGTPLNPFIPKPSPPPGHPKTDGST